VEYGGSYEDFMNDKVFSMIGNLKYNQKLFASLYQIFTIKP